MYCENYDHVFDFNAPLDQSIETSKSDSRTPNVYNSGEYIFGEDKVFHYFLLINYIGVREIVTIGIETLQ